MAESILSQWQFSQIGIVHSHYLDSLIRLIIDLMRQRLSEQWFQFVDYKNLETSVKRILNETRREEEVVTYLQKLSVEKYNLNNAMFMVLLDEMNLAHVELYFSDMLSKLERRRNSDEIVNIEIDMGAGMSKFQLELSDNILWVGTMNEDETTKSLSDKVLDRGNLISFPRPTEFKSRKKIKFEPAAKMLEKSVWNKWGRIKCNRKC